ncbi:MAG: hypothetical protein MZU79_08850 [Anaerotruncus sp.]|nr:hypothetical protein [Anaerotruncus sp.]
MASLYWNYKFTAPILIGDTVRLRVKIAEQARNQEAGSRDRGRVRDDAEPAQRGRRRGRTRPDGLPQSGGL